MERIRLKKDLFINGQRKAGSVIDVAEIGLPTAEELVRTKAAERAAKDAEPTPAKPGTVPLNAAPQEAE